MKLVLLFGRVIGEPAGNPWRFRISVFVLATGFPTLLLHFFGSRYHGPDRWIASACIGAMLGLVSVVASEAVIRSQSAHDT
jgi:hypothetical protein